MMATARSGRLGAGISRAASWWLKQSQASLPDALRAIPEAGFRARLAIRAMEQHVEITYIGRDGAEIFSERLPWANYTRAVFDRWLRKARSRTRSVEVPVCLVVPSAVCGSLPIPQQARGQADAIIRDHIARRTPLRLDEIFLGYDLKPKAPNKLDLHYLVLPQARLDTLLARLGLRNSEITLLESPGLGDEAPLCVPVGRRGETSSMVGRVALALAFLGCLAGITGFCTLAWRQGNALAGIEAKLAREIETAPRSANRLRSLYGMAEDIAQLSEMRSSPGVVEIWEELARLLPASTYLTELEVREAEILATGHSEAAPELIRLLEDSQVVHGAVFTGPVVQDSATGKERFSLRAVLRKPRLSMEEGS